MQPENYATYGVACLSTAVDDPGATACLTQLNLNLITATAASSLISCFFIGYFANLPLALAPGLGGRCVPSGDLERQSGMGD